jgi:hypothetical protein
MNHSPYYLASRVSGALRPYPQTAVEIAARAQLRVTQAQSGLHCLLKAKRASRAKIWVHRCDGGKHRVSVWRLWTTH